MTRPILYSLDLSPPCRAVLLTAAAIDLKLDVKEVSLDKGDHLTEDFLKMNPQHTIPVLDDDGFCFWDSHAISTYLVSKYAKNDSLYPRDLKKRAIIDQRLHFDSGVLFCALRAAFRPIVYEGCKKVADEYLRAFNTAYEFLEKFLENSKWMAGDSYTVADIALSATISTLTFVAPLDAYPKLNAWMKRCENELPGFKIINTPPAERLSALIRSKMQE